LENQCGAGRPNIGYVPQFLDFDRGTPITVLDFLSLKDQRKPLWLGHQQKMKAAAMESLQWAGATNLINRPLGKLSGGETQRALLAFALLGRPDIILLDEPVSGVDAAGEEIFAELLRKLQADRHFTVVLVSHDLSVVTQHADRVICLNKTVRCVGRTIEVLTPENLARLYGPHVGLHYHPNGVGPDPYA
jgi:zinc transport system ATP-binding protein